MIGQEPTEELVHVRLLVVKKGIEVYKGMPGQDSTVLQSIVIDPLFKYDERKKVLTPIT